MKLDDLNLEKCEKSFDKLKSYFDSFEIEPQIDYIKKYYLTKDNTIKLGPSSKLHPLAHLLYNAENSLSRIRLKHTSKISESLYRMALLQLQIQTLVENNVKNINEKLKDISSNDILKFEKILYEIEIGYELINNGYKFDFEIEDDTKHTHDITLHDGTRIDCKKRNISTQLEQKNKNLFAGFVKRSDTQIENFDLSIFIYFTMKKDLTELLIETMYEILKEKIQNSHYGKFSYRDFTIEIKKINPNTNNLLLTSPEKIIQSEFGYDFWHKIQTDNIHYEVTGKQNSWTHIFCLDSPVAEQFAEIKSTLKRGKKQIKWNGPSIIIVDIPYDPKLAESDFVKYTKIFEEFLKDNSSISALVLTTQVRLNWSGVVRYFYDGKVIDNKNAKYPLKSFTLFTDIENHVYELSNLDQIIRDDPNIEERSARESDITTCNFICVGCKNKIFLQANHRFGLPLLPNHHLFPKSKIFSCPNCNFKTNLTNDYELIKTNTGKEIFS